MIRCGGGGVFDDSLFAVGERRLFSRTDTFNSAKILSSDATRVGGGGPERTPIPPHAPAVYTHPELVT